MVGVAEGDRQCGVGRVDFGEPGQGGAGESLLGAVQQGFEGVGSTPEEFGAYIKAELAKWSKLFRELGLQIEQIR